MPNTAARCVARSRCAASGRAGERRRGGDRVSSYGPQVEVAIARVRADVAKLHAELTRYGLVVWTGGNVSGRVPGADLFVIKPSGVSYDDLAPENMILCDLDGNVIEGTPGAERSPVVGHRGARLRVPEHARGRRRRAHALDLRDGLGGARRGDPVRDHGDGRRVRRADPGRSVRDHRRRLDRPRHRRDPHRAPLPCGADAQPRAVHDRRDRRRTRSRPPSWSRMSRARCTWPARPARWCRSRRTRSTASSTATRTSTAGDDARRRPTSAGAPRRDVRAGREDPTPANRPHDSSAPRLAHPPHGPARGETAGMDAADSDCHQDNDVHE